MTIRFACGCGKKMKTTDDKIGKKILCPSCGSPVLIPQRSTVRVDTITASNAGTSQTAGDLLKAVVTEKASNPYSFDTERPKTLEDRLGFDPVASVKQVLSVIIPGLLAIFVVFYGMYWISNAVMTTDPDHPPLGKAAGKITVNGKPLAGAMVKFHPNPANKKDNRSSSSVARTDADGNYEVQYVKEVMGAAAGPHLVDIRAPGQDGRERIPKEYNRRSVLKVEVKEGSNEPFDFKLSIEGFWGDAEEESADDDSGAQ